MNPWQVLKEAIKQVPAMRYALAVLALVIVLSTILNFGIGNEKLIVGVLAVLVGMVLVFLFSVLTELPKHSLRLPALVLVWSVLVFVIAAGAIAFQATFLGANRLTNALVPDDSASVAKAASAVAEATRNKAVEEASMAKAAREAARQAYSKAEADREARATRAAEKAARQAEAAKQAAAKLASDEAAKYFSWTVCNVHWAPVSAAFMRAESPGSSKYIVSGWYPIKRDECRVLADNIPRGNFYFLVKSSEEKGDDIFWPSQGKDGDVVQVCIKRDQPTVNLDYRSVCTGDEVDREFAHVVANQSWTFKPQLFISGFK